MPGNPQTTERGFGYLVAFLYSLVVALLWIPASMLRRIARFWRELGVDSWPRANGTIIAGDVDAIHGWIVDYALGRLDYSYTVAGDYYSGSMTRQYPDEQAAWDFVDAHREKPVVVRYKDDAAHKSVLLAQDQDFSWGLISEPGFVAAMWQHWRDELRREPQSNRADEGSLADDE